MDRRFHQPRSRRTGQTSGGSARLPVAALFSYALGHHSLFAGDLPAPVYPLVGLWIFPVSHLTWAWVPAYFIHMDMVKKVHGEIFESSYFRSRC